MLSGMRNLLVAGQYGAGAGNTQPIRCAFPGLPSDRARTHTRWPHRPRPVRATRPEDPMHLVMLQHPGRRSAGIVLGDEVLDLGAATELIPEARLVAHSVKRILEAGDGALDVLRRIVDRHVQQASTADRLRGAGVLVARAAAPVMAPLPDPAIALACGLNYRAHLAEMNTPVPATPTAFTKSVASIIGTGSPIVLPRSNPDMVDWEGEFCRDRPRLPLR